MLTLSSLTRRKRSTPRFSSEFNDLLFCLLLTGVIVALKLLLFDLFLLFGVDESGYKISKKNKFF